MPSCPYCGESLQYRAPGFEARSTSMLQSVHYCTQYTTIAEADPYVRQKIRRQRLDMALIQSFKGEDRLAALTKALA